MSLQSLLSSIRPGNGKFKELDRRVIVYTTHKAGSMVLHTVLRKVCEKNKIAYYSPNQDPAKRLPFERIFNGEDFIAAHNGYFGPLRFFIPSAALENARIILHLRDPRDVLTSMFFSYCFMHPGEIAPNTGYRKEVAEAGIDKFVLDMSDENFSHYRGDYGTGGQYGRYIGNVHERYTRYLKEVAGRPNATVLSYEEMVFDFASWLRKFLVAFELDDLEETYEFVRDRVEIENDVTKAAVTRDLGNVASSGENICAHKRKATPGDYKEKLSPKTILNLNARFSEVLDTLGYSSPHYEMSQKVPSIRRS
jgi:Sulfotransferase domain